jgi:hypothetical protein
MTRARDIADQQDNLGGAVAPIVGGKNYIIGGGFDIWQRGTSFTLPNAVYTADRWRIDTAASLTLSQQTTGVPVGSRYCMRVAFNATTYSDLSTYIETANVVALQGNTVTVQMKLRRNATMTSAMGFTLQKSATVDAGYGAAWTTIIQSNVPVSLPTGTGSSDWYQHTFTTTIPNDGTANSLRIIGGVLATNVNGAYWEIAQVQLEIGSVATPFARAGGSIGGELALCQRYYYRATSAVVNVWFGVGNAGASNAFYPMVSYKTTMRSSLSSIDYSNLGWWNGGSVTVASSININQSSPDFAMLTVNTSGLTAGNSYMLGSGSGGGFIGFSAEL